MLYDIALHVPEHLTGHVRTAIGKDPLCITFRDGYDYLCYYDVSEINRSILQKLAEEHQLQILVVQKDSSMLRPSDEGLNAGAYSDQGP